MGRTNPTYRDQLRRIEDDWGSFRRALRRDDKAHFDRLFVAARNYADAAGYQNHPDPMVAVLVSVLIDQQRRLAELEEATSGE